MAKPVRNRYQSTEHLLAWGRLYCPTGQRVGQYVFNTLAADIDPDIRDIAEAIRGTAADPFHAENEQDHRFVAFKAYLYEFFG